MNGVKNARVTEPRFYACLPSSFACQNGAGAIWSFPFSSFEYEKLIPLHGSHPFSVIRYCELFVGHKTDWCMGKNPLHLKDACLKQPSMHPQCSLHFIHDNGLKAGRTLDDFMLVNISSEIFVGLLWANLTEFHTFIFLNFACLLAITNDK